MPTFRIILVEPKYQGNVGSVARVMKNFGQVDLALVEPPTLGDDARARAMHAWDLIEAATRHETVAEAIRGCDYVIGTSARIPDPDHTYLRSPVDVRELPDMLRERSGKIALLFGREDFGLFNQELELCDLLVTIPTSDLYKSLNLSQAVGIVLYELFARLGDAHVRRAEPMSEAMRTTFLAAFDRLIDALDLPEHKMRNTKTAYRKLFGRAVPSAWEYYVMMGVLRKCLERFGIELPEAPLIGDFDLPEDVATMMGAFESGRQSG